VRQTVAHIQPRLLLKARDRLRDLNRLDLSQQRAHSLKLFPTFAAGIQVFKHLRAIVRVAVKVQYNLFLC
jgi:hypothetical protein